MPAATDIFIFLQSVYKVEAIPGVTLTDAEAATSTSVLNKQQLIGCSAFFLLRKSQVPANTVFLHLFSCSRNTFHAYQYQPRIPRLLAWNWAFQISCIEYWNSFTSLYHHIHVHTSWFKLLILTTCFYVLTACSDILHNWSIRFPDGELFGSEQIWEYVQILSPSENLNTRNVYSSWFQVYCTRKKTAHESMQDRPYWYSAKRLAGKNVSEMAYDVSS